MYREDFILVDQFHASALHVDRDVACREANTNFADESACLTADNVRNIVVTIHGSQEVLKMLSLYTQISFAIFSLRRSNKQVTSSGNASHLYSGDGPGSNLDRHTDYSEIFVVLLSPIR
jgi:hypothetical protein